MAPQYKNPPIEEALCEFRFDPSEPWDVTFVGVFYQSIRDEFPEKREKFNVNVNIKPEPGVVSQQFQTKRRMQFLSEDKKAILTIQPDILSVSHLKPYLGWENFKPVIFDNLKKYREVTEPKGFKRIGLRYINRIDLGEEEPTITDYFNYYPFLPRNLGRHYDNFNNYVEIPYESGGDRLLLRLATALPNEGEFFPVLLDLDYILMKPDVVPVDGVEGWIENAHSNVEKIFESCITDKIRKLIGG